MKYDTESEAFEEKWLEKHVGFAGKDVLEIGCGAGYYTFRIAEKARNVVATDSSAKELEKGKKALPARLKQKVLFKVGSMLDLKFADNSFDIVFGGFVFHEVPLEQQDETLREVHRVLRPNGAACFIDPTPESLSPKLQTSIFILDNNHGEQIRRSYENIERAVSQGLFKKRAFTRYEKKAFFNSKEELYEALFGLWAFIWKPSSQEEKRKAEEKIDKIMEQQLRSKPILFPDEIQMIVLEVVK